jgi:hypothetical protein
VSTILAPIIGIYTDNSEDWFRLLVEGIEDCPSRVTRLNDNNIGVDGMAKVVWRRGMAGSSHSAI